MSLSSSFTSDKIPSDLPDNLKQQILEQQMKMNPPQPPSLPTPPPSPLPLPPPSQSQPKIKKIKKGKSFKKPPSNTPPPPPTPPTTTTPQLPPPPPTFWTPTNIGLITAGGVIVLGLSAVGLLYGLGILGTSSGHGTKPSNIPGGALAANCNPPCVHGTCTISQNQGICVCDAGFAGRTCDTTCGVVCSINGTCIISQSPNPDICQCNAGYQGISCSEVTPPDAPPPPACPTGGIPGQPQSPCSSHGTCDVSTGVCTCKPGWDPPNCSTCQPQGWVVWPVGFSNWGYNSGGISNLTPNCYDQAPHDFSDGYFIEANDITNGQCYSTSINKTFAWIASDNYMGDMIRPFSDPLANIVMRAGTAGSTTSWGGAAQVRVNFSQFFTAGNPQADQNWGTLFPSLNSQPGTILYTGVGWQDTHGNCGDCFGWSRDLAGFDWGCGVTPNSPYLNSSTSSDPQSATNYGCGGNGSPGFAAYLCMSLVLPPP